MKRLLLVLLVVAALSGAYTWGDDVASGATLHPDADNAMSDPGGGGNYLPECYYTGQMHYAWGQWWRCVRYNSQPGGVWFPTA
jgi:hypothetical protein